MANNKHNYNNITTVPKPNANNKLLLH